MGTKQRKEALAWTQGRDGMFTGAPGPVPALPGLTIYSNRGVEDDELGIG